MGYFYVKNIRFKQVGATPTLTNETIEVLKEIKIVISIGWPSGLDSTGLREKLGP